MHFDAFQGYVNTVPFGYVGIEERGGRFFDHLDTLEETLDSIADDSLDPPVDWTNEEYKAVEDFIRQQWKSGKIPQK